MPYDKVLGNRLRERMKNYPGALEKKMFGGIAYLLKGNMACGVIKDELVIRVGPQGYERAVVRPHVRPFDFSGRPMQGWIMVAPEGYHSEEDLKAWVQEGVDYALSLPEK